MQRLGFAVAALGNVDRRQVFEALGGISVLGVQRLGAIFLRFLVERVRFGVATLLAAKLRRCLVCPSRLQLQFSKLVGFFADRQPAFQERLSRSEPRLPAIELGKRVEIDDDPWVFKAVLLLRRR